MLGLFRHTGTSERRSAVLDDSVVLRSLAQNRRRRNAELMRLADVPARVPCYFRVPASQLDLSAAQVLDAHVSWPISNFDTQQKALMHRRQRLSGPRAISDLA